MGSWADVRRIIILGLLTLVGVCALMSSLLVVVSNANATNLSVFYVLFSQ